MADMSYKPLDEFEDDDPTEEFEILLGHVTEPDGVTQAVNSIHVANQALEFQQLDEEIRAANDGVCELSSELRSRKEMMVSIQRELDQLRDFSEFLEKEVELGKGAVSDVTDELVSVRAQQNDVSEQLRRRNRQIAALRDKLAEKEAFIEQLARRADIADFSDERTCPDSQKVNGDLPAESAGAPDPTSCHQGPSQVNRLRMLVARHDAAVTMYPILSDDISIGTSAENDVQLENAFVSFRHAMITSTSSGCILKDLESSNGTWINQGRIRQQELRDGDLIDFGPLRFEFIDKPVENEHSQIEDESTE